MNSLAWFTRCHVSHGITDFKRILDGEIGCSTYNLRMCYFDASVKEHDSIEACLKELEEKLSPEVKAEPFMQECMEEFKENSTLSFLLFYGRLAPPYLFN